MESFAREVRNSSNSKETVGSDHQYPSYEHPRNRGKLTSSCVSNHKYCGNDEHHIKYRIRNTNRKTCERFGSLQFWNADDQLDIESQEHRGCDWNYYYSWLFHSLAIEFRRTEYVVRKRSVACNPYCVSYRREGRFYR